MIDQPLTASGVAAGIPPAWDIPADVVVNGVIPPHPEKTPVEMRGYSPNRFSVLLAGGGNRGKKF
jgi:hypothetical protein